MRTGLKWADLRRKAFLYFVADVLVRYIASDEGLTGNKTNDGVFERLPGLPEFFVSYLKHFVTQV